MKRNYFPVLGLSKTHSTSKMDVSSSTSLLSSTDIFSVNFSGTRIKFTVPWQRNSHIATVRCGVSVLQASGNRCFPTDIVGAYQTKIRQPVGSIGCWHSIDHVGSSCSLVDCRLHVDIDSAVGDMLACGIVYLCTVAAGGDTVGDVEGCSWKIALACELWCWSNVRRTTAVVVGMRNLTSGGDVSGTLSQEGNSVLEVVVFLFCNCFLHLSLCVVGLVHDVDVSHTGHLVFFYDVHHHGNRQNHHHSHHVVCGNTPVHGLESSLDCTMETFGT